MKAVLVFCEGRHDVVFAQRSLGAHANCDWIDDPIGKLPSPFGPGRTAGQGLISRRLERYALDDLTLQAAAHPSPPCFESLVRDAANDALFVLVRTPGKGGHAAVLDLLRDLDLTITDEAAAGTFDVSDYAAAFLFDADQEGVAATLTAFRNHYRAHFGDLASVEHGKWVATNTVPVGFFVFHRSAQDQTGTLEDHLAPMVVSAWPARYAGARGFVDRYREANDKVSGRDAERLKAIITATGQFDHPGDPMSVIIGRTGLPRAQFTTSPLSQELADFLTGTPWNGG